MFVNFRPDPRIYTLIHTNPVTAQYNVIYDDSGTNYTFIIKLVCGIASNYHKPSPSATEYCGFYWVCYIS